MKIWSRAGHPRRHPGARHCFPTGDIALIKSIKEVKALPAHITKEEILVIAGAWKPYRTIAAYLLWHAYLSMRKKPVAYRTERTSE